VYERHGWGLYEAVGGDERGVCEPVFDEHVGADPVELCRDSARSKRVRELPRVRPQRERTHRHLVAALAEAIAKPPVVVEPARLAVDVAGDDEADVHHRSVPV
jgi:hypothetical protein